MFTERFSEALKVSGAKNYSQFARKSGYTATYITRMSRGERTPVPGRRASRKLMENIYAFADEGGCLEDLAELAGVSADLNKEAFGRGLEEWMFGGEDSSDTGSGAGTFPENNAEFAIRLDAACELANISNIRLARQLDMETTMIAKYRSGVRIPERQTLLRISNILYDRINAMKRQTALARLTNIQRENLNDDTKGSRLFFKWIGKGIEGNRRTLLVEGLLERVDGSYFGGIGTAKGTQVLSDTAVFKDKTKTSYRGKEGLRSAVLRFLDRAIRKNPEKLFLYADQGMEWMTEDKTFLKKWSELMNSLINSGTRICIIHNVNRGLEEMIMAIGSWIPLYMSGMVESYYCAEQSGGLFTHTMFLSRGDACIWSVGVAGHEESTEHIFALSDEELKRCGDFFDLLLGSCRPLIEVNHPDSADPYAFLQQVDHREAYVVQGMPTLATMSKELIAKMLIRSGLTGKAKDNILKEWGSAEAYYKKMLEKTVRTCICECIALPDDEKVLAGKVDADIPSAKIRYTPEEFAEHTQLIAGLMESSASYRAAILPEAPFENLSIIATNEVVIVRRRERPQLTFTITHPLVCEAFMAYAGRLFSQYGAGQEETRRKLDRFL